MEFISSHWVPVLSILALILSSISIILSFSLLKKVDNHILDMMEYMKHAGDERMALHKHADTLNTRIKRNAIETKRDIKRQSSNKS
jgi:hypothetical protein